MSNKKSKDKRIARKIFSIVSKLCALSLLVGFGLLALWGVYLHNTMAVTNKKIEADEVIKVYARPKEVYVGMEESITGFSNELINLGYRPADIETITNVFEQKNKSNAPVPLLYGQVDKTKYHSILYITLPEFAFPDQKQPSALYELNFTKKLLTAIYPVQGNFASRVKEVSGFRLLPEQIATFGENSNYTNINFLAVDEVPITFVEMLLATEDQQFYKHYGISIKGILRALKVNVGMGGYVQGGSTITQQLIKNKYLHRKKTIRRKIQEIYMAIILERSLSKEEILLEYINTVYLGQSGNTAISGLAKASEYYFNKLPLDLTIDEQALLVAMIKGPFKYHPTRNPVTARERRNQILDNASFLNIISQAEADHGKNKVINTAAFKVNSKDRYPGFMSVVEKELANAYDLDQLKQTGAHVFTTLDTNVQKNAEQAVSASIKQLEITKREKNLETAMIITSPDTGDIKALIPGKNPKFHGFNRVVDAKRMVGSIIKPAVYLSALSDKDKPLSWHNIIYDEPIEVEMPNSIWRPKNFKNTYYGEVTMLEAFINSYNLSTLNVGLHTGLDRVVDTIHKLGIQQSINYLPSVILGAVELAPIDVAVMYQTIANSGFSTQIRSISSVMNTNGEIIVHKAISSTQVFEQDDMFLLQTGLENVAKYGTAKKIQRVLGRDMNVAGKTGTSNDGRDSWFAGITREYVAVVWVGKDNNEATKLTGSSGALNVWIDVMKSLKPKPFESYATYNAKRVYLNLDQHTLYDENCIEGVPIGVKNALMTHDLRTCNSDVYDSGSVSDDSESNNSKRGWFDWLIN